MLPRIIYRYLPPLISPRHVSSLAIVRTPSATAFVLAACIVLTTGSVLWPQLTVAICVGGAIAICIVGFPSFGMAILVGFFVLQGSPLYQQYGILASRGATVADLAGILLLLAILAESVLRRTDPLGPLRSRARLPLLAVLTYFGWSILTTLWSGASPAVLSIFIRNQIEGPALLVLALLVLRDRPSVRWAMAAYAISGLLTSVYVVSHFASLHGFASGPLTLAQEQAYRGGRTGYNANELAVVLAVVPAMAYLSAERLCSAVRLTLTALTLPLVGFALIVLTSRGAIIDLGAGVAVALLLSRGWNTRAALGMLISLGAGLFALVSGSGALPRYFPQRFQLSATDQIGGRAPVWQLALDLFQRHPMGLGAMAFENLVPSANVALYAGVSAVHSDYIGSLVNYGIMGAILLAAMLLLLAREVVFKGGGRNPAVVVIFTVLLLAMASGDFLRTHSYWTIMSLVACYAITGPIAASGAARISAAPRSVHPGPTAIGPGHPGVHPRSSLVRHDGPEN